MQNGIPLAMSTKFAGPYWDAAEDKPKEEQQAQLIGIPRGMTNKTIGEAKHLDLQSLHIHLTPQQISNLNALSLEP